MILVVTNRRDATVDFATAALNSGSKRWYRLDTDRWPHDLQLEVAPQHQALVDGGTSVDLNTVTAVWWRRPVRPVVNRRDAAASAWAGREAHAALDAALRGIEARWVNHPDANRVAQSKPNSLAVAANLGMAVPSWLVTNVRDTAEEFAERHHGTIVVKSLHAGRVDDVRTLYTTRLADISMLRHLGPEPSFLQRFIDKVADIRAVVTRDVVYAVSIDSQVDHRTLVDVRAGDLRQLDHRPVALPSEIERQLIALVTRLDLRFAAVDLALDADGTHWFLEVNPNGQWAWLEQLAGVPVARTLARELAAT